jgi:hypothetical protein
MSYVLAAATVLGACVIGAGAVGCLLVVVNTWRRS